MQKLIFPIILFCSLSISRHLFADNTSAAESQPLRQAVTEQTARPLSAPGISPAQCTLGKAKNRPRTRFTLKKDTGWTVCHDLVKNYNRIQPTEECFGCTLQLDNSMPQFSWPEWTELKIEDYLEEIYAIESKASNPAPHGKLATFAEWREQYLADLATGLTWRRAAGEKRVRSYFYPRLRQARVRFTPGGRLETILGYTRDRFAKERCMAMIKECFLPFANEPDMESSRHTDLCMQQLNKKWGGDALMDDPGDYIVLYEPKTRKVDFISMGIGGGLSSSLPAYLFLHNNRAFSASPSTAEFTISRINPEISFSDPGVYMGVFAQNICSIFSEFPK